MKRFLTITKWIFVVLVSLIMIVVIYLLRFDIKNIVLFVFADTSIPSTIPTSREGIPSNIIAQFSSFEKAKENIHQNNPFGVMELSACTSDRDFLYRLSFGTGYGGFIRYYNAKGSELIILRFSDTPLLTGVLTYIFLDGLLDKRLEKIATHCALILEK